MDSSSDSDDSIDGKNKQLVDTEKKIETTTKRSSKERKMKSKKKKVKTESEPEHEKPEGKKGKTLLEILELEMKAKAIRALLGTEQKDNTNQAEETNQNETNTEKTDENKNWNERYEERKDVKEVVKTSRLCTNMRRRMLLHQQKVKYLVIIYEFCYLWSFFFFFCRCWLIEQKQRVKKLKRVHLGIQLKQSQKKSSKKCFQKVMNN